MEATTGTPAAEFGDKSSLIAGHDHAIGARSRKVLWQRGSELRHLRHAYPGPGDVRVLGYGTAKFGNFFAIRWRGTGRFLIHPSSLPFTTGKQHNLFDRLDFQPTDKDIFHLNLFAARKLVSDPQRLRSVAQDQRERVFTWNIAPGYQHTFIANTLLTINPYSAKIN